MVWASDMPEAEPGPRGQTEGETALLARHNVWLFGQPLLTLWYAIRPRLTDAMPQHAL